jgi:hypothetical protein
VSCMCVSTYVSSVCVSTYVSCVCEYACELHVCEYESVYKEGLYFSCCLFFFSLSCNLLFILRIYCLSSSLLVPVTLQVSARLAAQKVLFGRFCSEGFVQKGFVRLGAPRRSGRF